MLTGISSTTRPASRRRRSPSTSGAPVAYGSARIGIAFALTAYIPLVASAKGPAEGVAHPLRRSDVPTTRAGLGWYRPGSYPSRRRSASRPRHRIARRTVRAAGPARHWMLPVGVHSAAVGVGVLGGELVSGRDAVRKAAVLVERYDVSVRARARPVRSRPSSRHRRPARRPRKLPGDLAQDGRQVLLLVPGGDEDERVDRPGIAGD